MKQNGSIITLETDYLIYSFDTNGIVTKFADKRTGINYVQVDSAFAFLTKDYNYMSRSDSDVGNKIFPLNVSAVGGLINVEFYEPKVIFTILPQEFAGNIRLTVINVSPEKAAYKYFVFGGCKTNAAEDDFTASAISLNMKCITVDYPGRGRNIGIAICGELQGPYLSGAIIAAPKDLLPDKINEAMSHISVDDFPLSSAGGANALSYPGVRSDYYITGQNTLPANFDKWLDELESKGIKQVNFHQGGYYRQSDFVYNPELFPNGAVDFKQKVSEPMIARDFIPCFHTYCGLVGTSSRFVTPVPHPDLDAQNIYVLESDIDGETDVIPVNENVSDIPLKPDIILCNTLYIVIEQEIIEFHAVGGNKFLNCSRGAFKTTPALHKKGSEVKHLSGECGMFQPIVGSGLFYEQALETAKAYNEGGYRAIYLDAADFSEFIRTGIYSKKHKNYGWYYIVLFVREILRHTKIPPILELSTMNPNLWYSRSRKDAWDHPTAAFQHFVDLHKQYWEKVPILAPQLGWYHLYPIGSYGKIDVQPNWSTKIMYWDDMEHFGTTYLIYDSCNACLRLSKEEAEKFPVYIKYEQRMAEFTGIRDSGYFSDTVKQTAKKSKQKYKLINDNGIYGLRSFARLNVFPRFLTDGDNYVTVTNPFTLQKPFIRIEARHTCLFYDNPQGITVANFDKEKEVREEITIKFNEPLDLRGKEGLGMWVFGNGGNGYLNIQLESGFSESFVYQGCGNHVIFLNFTDWKYFTLCEHNNGDYPELFHIIANTLEKASDKDYHWFLYKNWREMISYKLISNIKITPVGETSGVKISDIRALPLDASPVKNPGVIINGKTLTFNCELKPGEYIEYTPDSSEAAIYDVYGNKTVCGTWGELAELPEGESVVSLAGGGEGYMRLISHFIVEGKTLFNEGEIM